MAELTDAGDYHGRFLCDSSGERVGRIDEVYLDTDTDRPEFALVNTGLPGTRSSFVPLRDAVPVGDEDVRVPLPRERMDGAPSAEPGGQLSEGEEAQLYEHYGMELTEPHSGSRSEDEARAGSEGAGRGRLRLRRYVVTEYIQATIPVQHEEVHLEREDDTRP
ncbi:MAG: PRC and DUF2382 domain-containing protein [Actinomycetota bacterium]|nr:PRC and DUF2382 domain-containing protein [Actinomycetota bacterium]MDQ3648453.1 PRC and DUF2382 domain-containing protein [Actinomycetota bacterium]